MNFSNITLLMIKHPHQSLCNTIKVGVQILALWRSSGSLYFCLLEFDVSSDGTYELLVRNVEKNVVPNVNPVCELIQCRGIYRGFKIKVEVGLPKVNAANIFDFVADLINRCEAGDFLVRFDNYKCQNLWRAKKEIRLYSMQAVQIKTA